MHAMTRFRSTAVAALAAVTVIGLAACGGPAKPRRTVTVTVPPSASPTGTGTAANTGSASPTAAATSPGAVTALPGTCDDLLTDYTVSQGAGVGTLGKYVFVVGLADKGIGRLANINCRYGVAGSGASSTSKVEIGVSLYRTAAQAATRIAATAGDFTAHGAHIAEVVVGGSRGQLLTGGTGEGYTEPTLVVAAGQRTVAVTVSATLATGTAASADATKIAALAVEKTAG